MSPAITVVIPTIPPRAARLGVAIESVLKQNLPATALAVPVDVSKQGAAINRQRGLDMVQTEFVAFLDDDDYFKRNHLELLMETMLGQDADFVFSWYDVGGGGQDPRPEYFGKEWNPADPHQTTITTLVKTELAQSVGFIWDGDAEQLDSPDRLYAGEDWFFTKGCNDAGAKIVHLPERTWVWNHWGGNTSGLPKNW